MSGTDGIGSVCGMLGFNEVVKEVGGITGIKGGGPRMPVVTILNVGLGGTIEVLTCGAGGSVIRWFVDSVNVSASRFGVAVLSGG